MVHSGAGERQTVFARSADVSAERVRIAAPNPDALLDLFEAEVAAGVDPGVLLVDLDSAVDGAVDGAAEGGRPANEAIALGAVLVQRGVTAIETTHVRSLTRLFDTHAAIAGASIDAIATHRSAP